VLRRALSLLLTFVAAIVLVALAVANRHDVRLVLDPFNPRDPVLAAELPLYGFLLAALILGVVIGGLTAWIGQGKWRRLSRVRAQDAIRWKAEAERLRRERDASAAEGKLAAARR
jgi:hypothetical protein